MRIYSFLVAFAFLSSNLFAQVKNPSLFLIPQPKKIEFKSGTFSFTRPYTLSSMGADTFAAMQLQEAIAKKFNVYPAPAGIIQANLIQLIKASSDNLDNLFKFQLLNPPFALGDEGYVLAITPTGISVMAQADAGVFYGVQTLIQLLDANSLNGAVPCMVIYDKPDMQMRGWQDDISRGPIPTMDFLKEEIRRMASFKLNTFTLYTEHVFKLKKHPEIAPPDGITAEQVEELVRFARNYHVDIIGNYQSFGHFDNTLKVPGYEKLAENEHTLSPAKEESYQFLKDVYSEIAPAYSSPYFHINCDEVELGGGPSQKMIDSMGIAGVYACHINRIDSLLKPYHKRIMMWGDIAVDNPQIIARLPRDMIIVCWDYGPMDNMDNEILPFVKSGFQFIVAPGVSCWNRIYPDLNRATSNIYNFLRDGYKYHALGFINTTWDDDGQNLFNNNWYPLIWGADCGWNAPADESQKLSEETREKRLTEFDHSYNRIYYGTDSCITCLLHSVSDLSYIGVKNCLLNSSIWNPLLPQYELQPESYERNNQRLTETIDKLLHEINRLKPFWGDKQAEFDLLPFALRQARLVVSRNLLGIKLKNYTLTGTIKNIDDFERNIRALDDTARALKAAYAPLWKLENRPWWLDTVYALYDSFPKTLDNLKGVCILNVSDTLVHGKREIQLHSAFNSLPVYYTTDGSEPTLNSTLYLGPVYTDKTIRIRARVIDDGRMYGEEGDSLIYHKGIGKLYKLNCQWSDEKPAYSGGGKYALLDGRRGSKTNFFDGRWQGYLGQNIDIELDMGQITPIAKIAMGFAQLIGNGILLPSRLEISTSNDGEHYSLITSAPCASAPRNDEERNTNDYIIPLNGIHCRYLKIVARNAGPLPEWHFAKGQPSWLFADEIVVE